MSTATDTGKDGSVSVGSSASAWVDVITVTAIAAVHSARRLPIVQPVHGIYDL
eukprot:m.181340 g.181340  ORF g.181340 m.181340 type:complete len:53 (+) comp15235_c0_seq1:2049-2207(+)